MLKLTLTAFLFIFVFQSNYMTGMYWKHRPVREYGPCNTRVIQKPFIPQAPGHVMIVVECPLFASVSTAALFASQYARDNHLGVTRLINDIDPLYKGEKRMTWILVLAPEIL